MRDAVTGLERCLAEPPEMLRGARFGLLMNQASVDSRFRYACDLLAERFPGQLVAIFSPQHGLWGEQQANMIESPHGRYEPLDVPVYSLYSQTRRPTQDMLRGLDCLVVDLPDVGTRVYTFAWTIRECLAACAEADIPVLILDRPNPLGCTVEGPLLVHGFESFVGGATIPMRHGLTLGELARLMNAEQRIGAKLDVISSRHTPCAVAGSDGRCSVPVPNWVPPSPNMPRLETALVYPGQVLLEGTNLSEGRGTTRPFEWCGAPFIDPFDLVGELEKLPHPGLALRPVRFVPTFDKWRGQSCGGVALHVVEPEAIRSVAFSIGLFAVVKRLYPRDFAWLPPPYEYETEKMPIDILYGSSRLRTRLEDRLPLSASEIADLAWVDEQAWRTRAQPFRHDG